VQGRVPRVPGSRLPWTKAILLIEVGLKMKHKPSPKMKRSPMNMGINKNPGQGYLNLQETEAASCQTKEMVLCLSV
jgi:hypothetical protein